MAQASESKDGSSRAQGEHTQKGQARQPELPPIYVDEEGNPVPPPPDVPALQGLMREALKTGHYSEMLLPIQTLREVELNREEREELLYNAMTALYEVSRPDFAERSQELISAANEAMNFNLDSPRVPDALAVLATVNLALGNVEDARGYTQLLRRKYPHSLHVPAALLELGAKEMERQEYAEAALTLQTILQEYPDSPLAKNAARLETYALYRQGHMERALTLVDFVERRWPRLYLEDPEYLAISADIRFRQGHLEDALRSYWTQYNLKPLAPEAASTLQHIATAYYLLGNSEAAAKVLDQLVQAFPQSAEAPAALLHLGENGIHDDNPTVDELIALFEAPNPRLPGLYYQRIINEYPESPEFMTAQLRSIVWQLWNEEYYPAMTAARGFLIDYADKPESNRARTVLLRGFAHELGTSLREENFERVLRLWEDFPQVHDEYLPLEPDMRMALARANLNRGNEQEGLELLSAFLNGPGDTDDALYSYNLFLATYLNQQNWDGILSLGEKVENWPLPEEARNQLDYAMALSAENLGLQGRALPLWTRLAERTDIPLYQRAYATYFLARSAEERQDLRAAYQYNLDTLGMFTQLQDEQSPYADPERVRESIAALMDVTEIAGRYAEALEWANRYALFVPDSSPDYAGLQFREAGLHRKMGDMTRWRVLLQGIVDREPDSVFGKMAASELRTQDVARDLTRFTGN
ncbi:MAG: tetratricopeptide repeat protein [Desulfovibrionaceae bacterium]|nr:tetratricopeptide repeat protein [Desulfovibrionaceae bacterium]